MADLHHPYLTIRTVSSNGQGSQAGHGDNNSMSSGDSYTSASGEYLAPAATHDISRVNYHVKHLDSFAKSLENAAMRSFPNRGRPQQRYSKVVTLLLHWKSDDLFVLPELEDLEKCLREDYGFETDTFPIPSENAHLELMLRVGSMIKDYESPDTLFIVYYGGHARIDESRQSTWCATRNPNSPWLQWSAIQTLLERSMSDTLILLDCCAGAASATFPNGKSITETISASSWDAIAPDPGRYSFTNALIEVLQEWRVRTFSAAMLHAEILARLKHPRPITINGKLFEARSTPVHFMMTANHRAPSIEIGRLIPRHRQLPSPPMDPDYDPYGPGPSRGRGPLNGPVAEPNEDEPHVMISLALEDNQNLDINAWQTWLASFPALAKYVKVQGVFKSHSTLLLLSVPVMIWDLLPEDRACSFVAFIRSNNLANQQQTEAPESVPAPVQIPSETSTSAEPKKEEVADDFVSELGDDGDEYFNDRVSVISGTTFAPTERAVPSIRMSFASSAMTAVEEPGLQSPLRYLPPPSTLVPYQQSHRTYPVKETNTSSALVMRQNSGSVSPKSKPRRSPTGPGGGIPSLTKKPQKSLVQLSAGSLQSKTMAINQQKAQQQATFDSADDFNERPPLAAHIASRLEEYFQREPNPSVGITEFFASNLGVETRDIDIWFHRRRQQELTTRNLQSLVIDDAPHHEDTNKAGTQMILPGHLNRLLEIFPASRLLFVDLRPSTSFEKSHIIGAANLRVPASFVENGFSLLDRAFADDQSRRNFVKAPTSRCIIFYNRVTEFSWECPIAEVLVRQLRENKDWDGDYYVLKGHYREFSTSFDKYIEGDKITQAAKDYADGLRQRSALTSQENAEAEEKYAEWKTLVENENRVPMTEALAAKQEERRLAARQSEMELEIELERRNPVLYSKVIGLRSVRLKSLPVPTTRFDTAKKDLAEPFYPSKEPRAELVEPLSRGLERINAETPSYGARGPSYGKLGDLIEPAGGQALDEFDEIDPQEAQFRDDPSFPKADDLGGLGGSSGDLRRARDKSFWKRLRTTK